jgi:hypothetical protein
MNKDEPQPVAYDAEGRPLYAHPPAPQQVQQTAPSVVQVIRPISPEKAVVSPEAHKRHEESKLLYPLLNLSDGEYVISAVRRHPIGLFIPLGTGTLLIGIALGVLFNYGAFTEGLALTGVAAEASGVVVPILLFCLIVALGMFVSWYVYVSNKFFLTNESVIQEIQHSLFSRLEQTVSLSSIEDVSFTQVGIFQQIIDYGDIRLSTEGDETTYRFSYVASPKTHVTELNNAVEAFKNGRPVGD